MVSAAAALAKGVRPTGCKASGWGASGRTSTVRPNSAEWQMPQAEHAVPDAWPQWRESPTPSAVQAALVATAAVIAASAPSEPASLLWWLTTPPSAPTTVCWCSGAVGKATGTIPMAMASPNKPRRTSSMTSMNERPRRIGRMITTRGRKFPALRPKWALTRVSPEDARPLGVKLPSGSAAAHG